ncbi:MAG TPA: N-acetylmuramoyl-L-alanine amidase [Candidatus Hydrogenedentes bacterium]|nr:N-acetylmuramoyl-L-alanine amidase [Candidatus Hydrogenedentota bacterium]HOL76862.1 N-acetylmuramoyl-L-alanine amidase [Candidatus Hydrogenedentota bacterium]HPO85513.1 N-acetylmuramoyl-L-alanine amidase [Candidatus Hydrogenedentota bacterium]
MQADKRGKSPFQYIACPRIYFQYRQILVLAVFCLLLSCHHFPLEPVKPISTPTEEKQTFQVSGKSKTFTGWHICLDPGHGGSAAGAIAPVNGLRESDVNLRVALEVRQILEQQGVLVTLTRDVDKSLSENPSDDLSQRPAIAEQTGADLFVSLHHNADIVPNSQKNGLEVYYKLHDAGASLDLAQCLVPPLVKNLSHLYNTPPQILPGNYKVLRLSQLPAVLLESSYMTCDANATSLSSPDGIHQEAEGIAEGLMRYIRMSPPRFLSARVTRDEVGPSWWVSLDFLSDFDLDVSTFSLKINGKDRFVPVRQRGRFVVFGSREPLQNGVNVFLVNIRNSQGAAGSAAFQIPIDRPPARIYVRQEPEEISSNSGIDVQLEVTVLDAFGLPIKDGTYVQLSPLNYRLSTLDGKARFYVPSGQIPARLTAEAGDYRTVYVLKYGGQKWRQIVCIDKNTHKPVPVAMLLKDAFVTHVSPEGVGYVPDRLEDITVVAPGYQNLYVQLSKQTTVALCPIEDGVFHAKRIVIDPAHGGRISGGIDKSGLRASDVSLDVALRAAALLRMAGAEVELTRSDDSELSDLQRLRRVEELRPDVLLVLSYGMTAEEARVLDERGYLKSGLTAFVGHYPNSSSGALLAECLARQFPHVEKVSSVAYLVQQSSCPSVVIQPFEFSSDGSISSSSGKVEGRQSDAAKIYAGLLEYFRRRGR